MLLNVTNIDFVYRSTLVYMMYVQYVCYILYKEVNSLCIQDRKIEIDANMYIYHS